MTKKMFLSKFTAVILCVLTMLSFSTFGASAAAQGGARAATVKVTTKANYWIPGASSVTLKQDKQTFTFQQIIGNKTKIKTGYYGYYNITVFNTTNGKSKSIIWNGGQTKKIKLDPNCSYRITVDYNPTLTTCVRAPFGYFFKCSNDPYWRVSSTWKVSSCY